MNSFGTVEEARAYAATKGQAVSHILQIDPGPGVKPYICANCNAKTLRAALARKPMPEIKSVVGVAVDLAAERWDVESEARKTRVTIYLSSRGWGDYSPVEWSGDITRPDAAIMADCRERLARGHDVDQPNPTDADLLAKIHAARATWEGRAAREAEAKAAEGQRRASGYCYACESWCDGDCGHYSNNPAVKFARDCQEGAREQAYGAEWDIEAES
jgi:hypothetical protein